MSQNKFQFAPYTIQDNKLHTSIPRNYEYVYINIQLQITWQITIILIDYYFFITSIINFSTTLWIQLFIEDGKIPRKTLTIMY